MAITEKQKAARTLGRLGGLKGGKARAAALTPERRKEISQKAIASRWAKSGNSAVAKPVAASVPEFFRPKTIEQLIAEQSVAPIPDLSALAGTIPDDDIDELVADIYRGR